MAANLSPEYREAEERLRKASTAHEKQAALTEMLRSIPKHKGTEKMQAAIKRRIARLRNEEARSGKGGKRANPFLIQPEGDAQILLLGPPNSGKSSLVATLTNARPEVADYPFTTRMPQPGMFLHQDVYFQLVDLPPIMTSHFDPWIADLARGADLAMIFADLASNDLLEGVEAVLEQMAKRHLHLSRKSSSHGLSDQQVVLQTLMLASRADGEHLENLPLLQDLYGERFEILPVSIHRQETLQALGQRLRETLSLIRVYTKTPGKEADLQRPFVLPSGSTIVDVARVIHKDFVKDLKFAKVWGSSQFGGQRVQRDFVVQDKDIVELHL